MDWEPYSVVFEGYEVAFLTGRTAGQDLDPVQLIVWGSPNQARICTEFHGQLKKSSAIIPLNIHLNMVSPVFLCRFLKAKLCAFFSSFTGQRDVDCVAFHMLPLSLVGQAEDYIQR